MAATAEMTARMRQRQHAILTAQIEAQQREKQLLVDPKNKTVNSALRNICYTLCDLAQKYVPNSTKTFSDYSELLHCIKLLRDMGLRPPVAEASAAHVASVDNNIVCNSFEYRNLRNRVIACLATVADLTEKPTASGSADYQAGMREGYRRASDIAANFLADFGAGDEYAA